MAVQTVLVPKDNCTKEEAQKWCRDHDYKDDVDETDDYYRFRQFPPEDCAEGSQSTITIDQEKGIKAVTCTKQEESSEPEPTPDKTGEPDAEKPNQYSRRHECSCRRLPAGRAERRDIFRAK